jgi:hypothetical protein
MSEVREGRKQETTPSAPFAKGEYLQLYGMPNVNFLKQNKPSL